MAKNKNQSVISFVKKSKKKRSGIHSKTKHSKSKSSKNYIKPYVAQGK